MSETNTGVTWLVGTISNILSLIAASVVTWLLVGLPISLGAGIGWFFLFPIAYTVVFLVTTGVLTLVALPFTTRPP